MPIGDPQSGVHTLGKVDWRRILKSITGYSEKLKSDTLEALENVSLNSDALIFQGRNSVSATLIVNTLIDGDVAWMDGLSYQVDSTATGANSATGDLSVDGLVPFGMVFLEHFGAVPDNSTISTSNIQAAINYAVVSGQMVWIKKSVAGASSLFVIDSPISVTGPINIGGDGRGYCGIVAQECNGFEIAAGVNFVNMSGFGLLQRVRYSDVANSHIAVKTLGTTVSRNFWHTYTQIFFDGWYMPFDLSYFWGSTISACVSVFAFGAIYARGLSVNNHIHNNEFGGVKTAGSVGIQVGDGVTATEGWFITDNLIAEFAIGVRALGAGNSHVRGNIIDFFQQYGVILEGTAAAGSINWIVDGNYMATDNAAGSSAVRLLNNFAGSVGQDRGHSITDNQILKYSGGGLAFGISQDGTQEQINIITGNRVDATTFSCRVQTGGAIVTGNRWLGGMFQGDVPVTYANNTGGKVHTASNPNPAGPFTPVVFGTLSAGAGTYSLQKGDYNLVDGVVHFSLRITWLAHTGTGAMRISGLPFTVKNDTNYFPSCNVMAEGITFPASCTMLQAFVRTNAQDIELRATGSGIGATAVMIDTAGHLNITGRYRI